MTAGNGHPALAEERLDAYMDEIGKIPLLTSEQEHDLGRQVVEFRQAHRRDVLGSDGVLRQVVEALRRVVASELPFDRTVETSARAPRAALAERLPAHVARLESALEKNRADFGRLIDPKTDETRRARLVASLAARRLAVVPVVEQLPIQTPKLAPLLRKLERISVKMTELETAVQALRAAGCDDAPRLESELLGYRMHMLEEPCDLRRRMEDSRRSFALYHRAKSDLARGNLRLAVTMAKRYRRRGLPLPDLVQEANSGLLHAVDKFDSTLGYRFSSYAAWWIKRRIRDAIKVQGQMIRTPGGATEAARDLWTVLQRLTQELGREPSEHEIAGEARMDLKDVRRLLRDNSVNSLSTMEDRDELEDELEDGVESPVEEAGRAMLRSRLEEASQCLTYREREIVKLRFGLAGGYTYTFEECSRIFKLTRERCRQLEASALAKLRCPEQAALLAGFLEPVEA